jgi:hypothetical protein
VRNSERISGVVRASSTVRSGRQDGTAYLNTFEDAVDINTKKRASRHFPTAGDSEISPRYRSRHERMAFNSSTLPRSTGWDALSTTRLLWLAALEWS